MHNPQVHFYLLYIKMENAKTNKQTNRKHFQFPEPVGERSPAVCDLRKAKVNSGESICRAGRRGGGESLFTAAQRAGLAWPAPLPVWTARVLHPESSPETFRLRSHARSINTGAEHMWKRAERSRNPNCPLGSHFQQPPWRGVCQCLGNPPSLEPGASIRPPLGSHPAPSTWGPPGRPSKKGVRCPQCNRWRVRRPPPLSLGGPRLLRWA